jgi:hypothetical protein
MYMEKAEAVLNNIIEHLRVFYRFPAVFAVENGYVEVLDKADGWWYTYDVPIGVVDFALMFEGVEETPEEHDKPVELRLVEVSLRHLWSKEVMLDFFDTNVVHAYETVPKGTAVSIYAKIINDDIVFTDTAQLEQFIASRLKASLYKYCVSVQ